MSILVAGEALIDVVSTPGSQNRYAPGGSPANVALGLGRLGDEVALLTDFGDDFHGGFLLAHLRESGVEVLARPNGATSTALARMAGDGSAEYDFRLRWDPDDSLVEDRPRAVFHFGSIAAFLQPGAEVVDRLISRHASPGAARPGPPLLTFDPNIRPSIIGSHDAALDRFEQLAGRVDLVKLSDADADWLYPALDAQAQLDRLLELGADLVALTRGGDGAIVATASAHVAVESTAVEVKDTIGAGDAFMVSLVHELHTLRRPLSTLSEAELRGLGERAARLAAMTVGREGADLPWADDLTG